MDKETMLKAFEVLDKKLKKPAEIVIGGGADMLIAHNVPLSTMDIDGLLVHCELTPTDIDPLVKKVAQELSINPHWFNSYFGTFTYVIPRDYEIRIVAVYKGKNLKVSSFGLDDLLIMKCFSGREKDIGHAKALIKSGADLNFVDAHIQALAEKNVPKAAEALDFLDDIRDQLGK
jgi:hypothetical protein